MRNYFAILAIIAAAVTSTFYGGFRAGVMSSKDQARQQLVKPAAELVSRVKLTRYDLEQLLLHTKELERLADEVRQQSVGGGR